ncbi:MAG: hypothetical protein LBU04_05180, partial [Christensenellaceae bacterium]|nr:hypothetical protein [Christensenellaceae bacterium]
GCRQIGNKQKFFENSTLFVSWLSLAKRFIHMHFHGLFMYRLITSIRAPPAVNKQKLGLQKYSF